MKKLISNTCSGCAGEIKFEPKQQCLKCSYCENTFEIKESISNAEKYPYNESSAIKLSKDKYSQCICKSCDKTFFILNDNKNLSCPYCGGGEVDGAFDIAEVPDGIVPFKLNKVSSRLRTGRFSSMVRFLRASLLSVLISLVVVSSDSCS